MRAFQDMLLGPLKAVLMRALQQQLSKYIHNIELEGLGLLGGDVVLENLEIKKDVLHESLRIPTDYDISRGFIRELRIHIPWTRLQSRPIEIKFKTVEIIVTPITHTTPHQSSSPWLHSRQSRPGEEQASSAGAATGWLQQLLTKVLANMSVSVSNLVLKYEDADVVASAALKSLVCFSANPGRDWTPAFASLDDPFGLLHKLVRASDLTVCLDRYCAPDSTRRRQVQAFEVPILNRASFDVRLLACVWLVAPGPPESSFAAAWEYQQAQVDWQDGAENDGAGIPSSPGKSGSRRGAQRGTAESPKPPVTPKTPRSAVTVLGRLVGGDRRTGSGIDEVAVEGLTSGAAVGSAEVETDDLPLPCVCPLLRDGWSRRASSSYSPFFDGEGVWSPSEAAGASVRGGGGVDASTGGAQVEDGEEGGGVRGGGGGDEGQTMPTPIVVADVLIADLCFSLSNLQVQMVKELIESAVHHVARNASRNTSARPLGHEDPRLVPEVAQPAASRWWPFWREAALEDAGGDPRDDLDKASNAKSTHGTPDRGSPAPFESRDRDAMFVVASASIRSVQLHLLTHHEREGGNFGEKKDVEEAAADDEPESISVPVHGLGNVSVLSAPVSARKQPLRPPVAFVVAEVKGLVLDAHVLAGGDELSADVKVEVSSIVVRQAGLGDAASPERSYHGTPSASGNMFDQAEPVVSWGEAGAPAAPTASAEAADGVGAESAAPDLEVDRRPVADVQRLLVERARRLPRGGAGGELGLTEASPKSEGVPGGRGGPASAQATPSPSPTWWADAPSCSATKTMPEECALQYRLLKRKSSAALREGAGGGDPHSIGDAMSTVTSHNIAAGELRVQVAEALLEKLLKFADVGRQAEKRGSSSRPAGNPDSEEKQAYGADEQQLASAAAALAHRQGLLGRANRLSPRASNAGSAVSSPRVLPFVQSFSSASTWETSFNFALRSVAVALNLDNAGGCGGAGTRGGDYSSRGLDQVACCVLSLGGLDISGSESASVVRGSSQQHLRGWHASTSSERRESEMSQRVCSLSLGNLSVTFVDASALAAEERAPSASPRSVRRVFVAASLPGTHRLMQLSGARVTAEILSEVIGQAGAGGMDGFGRPINCPRGVPDFLFNTSVESLHVGASIGAALVVLEVCLLARKMTGDTAGARVSLDYGYGAGRGSTPNGRWERCWLREVGASFDGISLGGVVKGGGGQVKGNMRRLSVGRGGDSGAPVAAGSRRDVADVALFEAMPGEDGGEGLSWTLETFGDDEGTTDIELTSAFKSATLHYANTKKAVGEVMRVLDAWKAGASRVGVGMAARDAGGGAGANSSTAASRRSPSVKFTANGSVVKLHLPFELNLEVKGVHLGTRPAHQRLPTPNGGSASAGLDINVIANDVQVFHALYGARCSPEDALPPAICCAARGIVTLRPSTNATTVSLESEHVRAGLTPAFCAAFGSFIRYMVGPPARPSALAAASASSRVPKVFTFKLRVRGVDVDFIGDPCSPSAVSANIVVGEVSMKQKSVGETSPGAGSTASFGMSFETVEATQRRDPWRNAPGLPREAARLIGTFLGQVPGSDNDVGMSGGDLFSAWLFARKGPSGEHGSVGPSYTQPFIVRLSEGGREADGTKFPTEAFSVLSTSSGPRGRLVNSLSLHLTPILLACYPPSFRLLVGHYNRFGGNAFRSFRSRADMPPRRIAVISYDIDIRGCSAVLLASLADGARGIHVSAGVVTIKENTAAAAAAVTPHAGLEPAQSSSLAADEPIDDETTLALSGFIGPAGMSYLEDWRSLLPAAAGARGPTGRVEDSTNTTPLCVPIDLRWAVFYDRLDRCRQDISLSSVQLYLEQSHFDLCVRVAQAFIAADYPGALPPRRRRSTQTAANPASDDTTAPATGGQQDPVPSLSAHQTQTAASFTPTTPAANTSSVSNIAEVKNFLSMSLRIPLVQCVLAVGKRNGPFPPVLEIDVASVRLTRGGTLTVRHVSVNSWSQEVGVPMRSGAGLAMAAERGRSGCGYRVLGRSGQSEESGKDFLRMEVRVPDVQLVGPRTPGPTQPQLDVVIQVQPFDIHVNPSIICSLTSYVTPIPLAEGSSEATEVPFPHFLPPVVTPFHSSGATSASAARDESPPCDGVGLERGSSAGERVSTDFEKSAMTASASVRLLASQVSIELSSYPGGPALIAGASHVFVRAITWPADAGGGTVSRDEGAHCRAGSGGRALVGPEVFARLSRVTCGVKRGIGSDGDATLREDDHPGGPCRADQQGDTILKPFDIDAHLTRPRAAPGAAVGIASKLSAARGWHAGIYVDELYLRFGAVHTRSLEILANLFFPAMATASLTAAKLARGQREHGTAAGKQWQNRGHIGDLRTLERVECAESVEETAVTPEPGEAVFYGVGPPQESQSENEGTAAHTSAEEVADGWVHCCEWRYWGLRRVAQIALPYAPLRGVVPLLEGLAVDSLEVELSFMDPLTQTLEAATRFNVPCHASSGSPNVGFAGRQRVTVEPSQPFFARTWRLSWRIPAWLRSRDTAAAAAFPEPFAISTWSSLLLQALSVHSSPVGPTAGPSYFSTTLVAQRVTLAVLTDGNDRSSSSSLSSVSSRPPSGGGERGTFVQLEEIVRVVISDASVFAEASSAAGSLAATTRGSAEVAVDVQDFSNFLRLPLLSHALVKWDLATTGGRGGAVGGDEDLLSPLRPVAAAAVEVHDAVVSVSVTSMQCVEQCIAELSQQPSGAVGAGEGSSTGETRVGGVEGIKPLASAFSTPPQRQPRQRSKRYIITNLTDRALWFGQGSTTEALLLRGGEEASYRWRTTPAGVATASASRKSGASRLVLMLRLALHLDSGELSDQLGADWGSRGDSGPWTEPFRADDAGSYMHLLQSTGAGWQAGTKAPPVGLGGSDPMVLPLWVTVTKEGLQTRIVFHGEWVFTNHLPQEVQVAWVTSAGVGDAGRRLVEPVGMRGGLNLVACGPDKASDGSDAGEEAEVPRPVSCSALTACIPSTGSEPQGPERFSELMLEFRMATPDASTVVGSVGPPPHPGGSPVAHATAHLGGCSSGDAERSGVRRVGEGLDDDQSGLEEDDAASSGPWLVTRQSEWVEARPCVYLSLISCASPDPQSSGFWFWCVASRRASPLSDCAACVSRAVGHSCHQGQMMIDLRPVAVVWNRCSQPMRVALNFRGGRGEWRERNGPASKQEAEQDQARAQDERVAARERHSHSAYRLAGSSTEIQPGGRTAACKQPFVDYDLAVTPVPVGSGRGSDSEARPFLVSVPSELLSRRCESRWLPLHSRALMDNVLCPLVVIASRLVNADWPSLSLRVYPGLSMHNHLRVPLSLRTVFTRQALDVDWAAGKREVEATGGSENVRTMQDEQDPLLRREASGGNALPAGDGGGGGDGHGGSSGATQDSSASSLVRIVRAPAESCHSTWDIFHGDGYPIPYVLPSVSLELGIAPEEITATLPVSSAAGMEYTAVSLGGVSENATGAASPESVKRRSRKLEARLDDNFRELVLIPWGAEGGVVLPVFVTLEREQVLGGVELIKLAVYPRVVVHNATGLPISLSLLGAAQMVNDSNQRLDGDDETRDDAVPVCRVRLTPEGSESSMNMLALPGNRGVFCGPSSNYHDSSRAEGVANASRRAEPAETHPRRGLFGKISWLLGSSSYSVSPQPAGGFFADLEVAFGWDGAGQSPASGDPTVGKDASVATALGGQAANDPELKWRHPGVGDSAIFSVGESSGGVPFRSEPSSLKVVAEGGQRAVRVCIAAETPDADLASPTRHILLYQDPQPDITVCNRSRGPITLLFDCGALVEVYPGCTAEHSWLEAGKERSGKRERSSSTSSAMARPSRPPSATHPDHQVRGVSEMSDASTPTSSAPGSPAASNRGRGGSVGSRPGFVPGPGSIPAAAAARKARPSGKLGGDATLRHCFQCKGGSNDDAFVSWSDPLWVARGVQVIRFDNHVDGENFDDFGGASGEVGGGDGSDGGEGQGGFGAGSAREVQVHVVERAGGFLMSFAEGGFDGEAADGIGVEGSEGDAAAERRGVLRRWATTREHHVVVSVSGTTLQLLDDSNLQAVAPVGQEASQTKARKRETAARAASEGLGVMDGWAGGAWGEPGGFLSNGASAHLPAAALPAIISVFVAASSARLWQTAPAVRPGMSALDLERSWHLKDRVGIDVRLGTVQIDNHVAGHSLPVLFCFRDGGALVSANEKSRNGGDVAGDCRLTMSLVLAMPWKESRVPSYLEKVHVRSAPIDVCLEDSLLPPLLHFLERAGVGIGAMDGSFPIDRGLQSSPRPSSLRPQLPAALGASMVPRLFIQRVDIGVLVVRATVQGYIPGKQVFLALDKSPLMFRPVSLRGVLARPDQIAEQIASNYAVDALLRSLAVVGSLEALGSPTTLLSEWGKGVYDLFAMPIKALPQGPSSTVKATFRGLSSLLRHASAGTLSSVSGVTNALSRNLGGRGGVVRPIAGTMGLVHRTSRSLIASTGVDSEWAHAKAATEANPAVAHLNADLWYRSCLLPEGHEFLYQTPALCSNASYSQANVPVTIVLSSKAVFLYRGGSGCEELWKQIEHQDITLIEQSADHAPAELILNARAYRRPRSASSSSAATARAATQAVSATPPAVATAAENVVGATADTVVPGRSAAALEAEEVAVGGLLIKLSLPSSAWCRELAQLLHGLSGKA